MKSLDFSREVVKSIKSIISSYLSFTIANQANYNSFSSVDAYSQIIGLRKAEQAILDVVLKNSPLEKMLDIGVGGGRTTEFFSKVAQTYIGIDYSKNMITICQKKFKNNSNLFFTFADARDLKIFHDNSFDFILFSHGGLDAVGHSDRLHILNEIRRVAKRNALFSFSTSNLNSMFGYCSIKISKNPKVLCKRVIKLLLVRLLNEELWLYCRGKNKSLSHTMFNLGTGNNWGLKTYCITATEQIKQLTDVGFDVIAVYDMKGKKVKTIKNIKDFELYFLCKVMKE